MYIFFCSPLFSLWYSRYILVGIADKRSANKFYTLSQYLGRLVRDKQSTFVLLISHRQQRQQLQRQQQQKQHQMVLPVLSFFRSFQSCVAFLTAMAFDQKGKYGTAHAEQNEMRRIHTHSLEERKTHTYRASSATMPLSAAINMCLHVTSIKGKTSCS